MEDLQYAENKAAYHLKLTEKSDGAGRGHTKNWIIEDLKSWCPGWKISAGKKVQDAIDQGLIIKTGKQDELYNDLWIINPEK